MYKSFRVKNYRCFDDLTVEPLERVNLIAGKNNVGKTALLEALWLHYGYDYPGFAYATDLMRGLTRQKPTEFLWDLFRSYNADRRIETESTDASGLRRLLHIRAQKPASILVPVPERRKEAELGSIPYGTGATRREPEEVVESELIYDYTDPSEQKSEFRLAAGPDGQPRYDLPHRKLRGFLIPAYSVDGLPWLAERLSELSAVKRQGEVVKVLKIIEPRLEDIQVLQQSGEAVIHGDIGEDRLIPLPLMGDGMARLLRITLSLVAAQDGLLLVDEVENGLHYSVMKEVWRAIALFSREFDVQFFATTHSDECIRAAHAAFSASQVYDFRLHRLELADEKIRSVTYDQETLGFALEAGWEVR